MNRTNRAVVVVISLAALLAVLGIGYWWGRSRNDVPTSAAMASPEATAKVLYWYDPMMPQERYAKPGKSSMNSRHR